MCYYSNHAHFIKFLNNLNPVKIALVQHNLRELFVRYDIFDSLFFQGYNYFALGKHTIYAITILCKPTNSFSEQLINLLSFFYIIFACMYTLNTAYQTCDYLCSSMSNSTCRWISSEILFCGCAYAYRVAHDCVSVWVLAIKEKPGQCKHTITT